MMAKKEYIVKANATRKAKKEGGVSTPWVEAEKAAKSLQDSVTFLLNHDATITGDEDCRLKCTEGTLAGFLEWIKHHKR